MNQHLNSICFVVLLLVSSTYSCMTGCYCEDNKITCENINISGDQLQSLQIDDKVTEMYLKGNNIRKISAIILEKLTNLKVLEISKNDIEYIPIKTFSKFNKLEKLILNNNDISKLSKSMFTGLTNLYALELRENKISELPAGVFNELKNIQDIRLNSNELTVIPNDVFSQLTKLRDLFFTRNSIHVIQDKAFVNLQMYRLGLSYNQLKSIPSTAFIGFQITGKVVLLENPLDCSCEFSMYYALKFPQLKNKVWGYCVNPYSVRNENILDAHKRMFCSMCDLKPCLNNGACTGNKTTYSCACDYKYQGDNCEIDICQGTVINRENNSNNNLDNKDKNNNNNNKVPTENEDTTKRTVINHTEYVYLKQKVTDNDSETKLIILYVMCAIEFIIILGFVAYIGLRKYREWKEEKEYNLKKTTHILFGVKNKTNAKLQKALYDTDYVLPGQMKELMLLDDSDTAPKMREIMMMDEGIPL